MAPPLIFLLFVIVVALLIVGGLFVATRTGLWVRETSTSAEEPASPEADEPRFDRPAHVEVEDPAKQRFIGT
jgi:hypothetical protein